MKKLMILTLIVMGTTVWAATPRYLTYDDFIRQVEAGNIKSVTLDDFSSIEGALAESGATNNFRSYAKTGAANDPLLMQFLKEHDVAFTTRDISQPSNAMPMMTGFVFLLLPFVFLILLIVIIRKLNLIIASQDRHPPSH